MIFLMCTESKILAASKLSQQHPCEFPLFSVDLLTHLSGSEYLFPGDPSKLHQEPDDQK